MIFPRGSSATTPLGGWPRPPRRETGKGHKFEANHTAVVLRHEEGTGTATVRVKRKIADRPAPK
jgi:hypothetical protein